MADHSTTPNASEPTPAGSSGAHDLSGLLRDPAPAGAPAHPGAPAAPAGDPNPPLAVLPDAVVDGGPGELEQFAQLSMRMPVLVEMHAAWSSEAQQLSPVLADVVRAAGGRTVLLRIDLDANPQLGQQPQVLALFGGQPMPLLQGYQPREQIAAIVAELLEAAASRGFDGRIAIDGEPGAEPAPAPLPPLHQDARDALDRGDIEAAKAAYQQALNEQPADDDAKVGLAQVSLLSRLQGRTMPEIRERAAANPTDVDAQLDVADLDLSGGHVDDAFNRLLTLFPNTDDEGRTRVRERLLELFDVVGPEDARVGRARQRLTSLLFA